MGRAGQARHRFVLFIVFAAVFVFSATMLALYYAQGRKRRRAQKTGANCGKQRTPVILAQYQELHERNADMVGWIKIDGTAIDYPVMYTADDFYLSTA
jgi:hypothetical protein